MPVMMPVMIPVMPVMDSCYGLLLWTPVIPVMTPVMMPVMDSCYDSWYNSCYACYVFPLWLLCDLWLYVLGSRWYEIKVYRWGFPCLDYSFDVLVSWSRDLSLYNQKYSYSVLYRISCFMVIMLYLFIPAIPVYTLVLTLARHLAFTSHSPGEFHLTPLDPHVQVMELGACGFSLLLIRVAQR